MSDKKYSWVSSVVTAKGYPAQVHTGHLSSGKKYLATLPKTGVLKDSWDQDGTAMMSGGSGVPTEFALTWVSYADKKFWKVEASLDSNKILALFEKGIDSFDGYHEKYVNDPYDNIVVAVAPGGIVAVFLTGQRRRVEVGYFQAKETYVDVNNFYDNPDRDTQRQFFDWWYNHVVPEETKSYIDRHGIPHKLWDVNRQKYNWRFLVELYDEDDHETERECVYLNGEKDQKFDSTLYAFDEKPLPWRVRFAFGTSGKWAETEFDSTELLSTFREMTKDNPTEDPIEIIGKVAFMYKGMEFRVRCGEKVILLEKVKVQIWKLRSAKEDGDHSK
jgi:hypothetical protein